jgi:hypothetical protein
MSSELAELICQTYFNNTEGALLRDVIDAELSEVREVLDGLLVRQWSGNVPILCWCDGVGDDEHSDACQRARALYEKLRIDK